MAKRGGKYTNHNKHMMDSKMYATTIGEDHFILRSKEPTRETIVAPMSREYPKIDIELPTPELYA